MPDASRGASHGYDDGRGYGDGARVRDEPRYGYEEDRLIGDRHSQDAWSFGAERSDGAGDDGVYEPEPRPLGRSLRFLLPIAGLALVAGVFFLSERVGSDSTVSALADGIALHSGLEVTNARYWGEADDGSPFRVSAVRARPDGPNPSLIELLGVRGEVDMPDGRTVQAEAADGLFKPKAQTLDLGGGVLAESSDGYRLRADALSFDLRDQSGESASAVRIDGPLGELTAATMAARFDGDFVIRFDGEVKVVIRELVDREFEPSATQ